MLRIPRLRVPERVLVAHAAVEAALRDLITGGGEMHSPETLVDMGTPMPLLAGAATSASGTRPIVSPRARASARSGYRRDGASAAA
jgi:hypothetical protein